MRGIAEVSASRIDFRLADGRRRVFRLCRRTRKLCRGRSASLVIFEEFAHFDPTAGPGSDQRLYLALRRRCGASARWRRWLRSVRRMVNRGSSLSCSATRGRCVEFGSSYSGCGLGGHPTYTDEQRDADRVELGEDGFAEEVGAEFVSGRGSFFDRRGFTSIRGGFARPGHGPGCRLDRGVQLDRSGGDGWPAWLLTQMALALGAVAALKPNRGKASSESFESERKRQDEMMEKVWEIIGPYSPRGVADLHKGGPIKSWLGRQGCSVTLTPPTGTLQKQQFVSLRARLEDGSLRAWSHPQLLQDLRRVRATDGDKIYLPKVGGSHCDAAVALSLAAWEHSRCSVGTVQFPKGRVATRSDQPVHLPTARPAGIPDWQWRLHRRQFTPKPEGTRL